MSMREFLLTGCLVATCRCVAGANLLDNGDFAGIEDGHARP